MDHVKYGSANINDRSLLGSRDSEIGVLIEDKEYVDSCMGGKPWKAGKFSSSFRLMLWSEHLRLPAGESYEEPWCPLITQLISLCAFNHPQMLSR
ncbi:Phospholipase D zeta 2 [Camellia lanceoleosa]|uniref:Phospholipase D zeta 2 n=1 Tax=Camellia lanceoleosa TaxID=1840588 RepID=A0ACC0G3M3_9ERIC|nr:Phospholipase D zeta 2 [Camellia lanceoleosa]